MNELEIVAFCPTSVLECWSLFHRCFVGRRERILNLATRVLGTRVLAERWLLKPALGLNHQLPCSMLSTRSGYEAVDAFLNQIEHGVYI